MKLIIRQYLSSLKERGELDAILPDLLSELGFTIFSRPGIGTAQSGVDVAAIGRDETGERKVFLLAIKRGDLTRKSWDGTPQALRAALNEIQDVYIPTKLPARYRRLKVVIVICLGGDIQEQVRSHLTGYEKRYTSDRISFEEWTGDELAAMLLQGVLREQLLPKELRSTFRKSVAMLDEPEVAFRHFSALVRELRTNAQSSQIARVRAARLVYLCVWILFVWARDIDNVEAPYKASELALLSAWDLFRPLYGRKNRNTRAFSAVFARLLMLHLTIASELLDGKIIPHVAKRYAISMAVNSRTPADVNSKLFDLLGRIAMAGLWHLWIASAGGKHIDSSPQPAAALFRSGADLIRNNPCLLLPLCDDQAVDVTLFLLLAATSDHTRTFVASWLGEVTRRLHLTVVTHGRYPCSFSSYREIVAHPAARSDEYRESATQGSILIPLLAAWLAAHDCPDEYEGLAGLKREELQHCTLQLWLPDDKSEEEMYCGGREHGVALLDLPLESNRDDLLDTIEEACSREDGFVRLSAVRAGYWPIVLLACRHHRFPVPPQYWIKLIRGSDPSAAASSSGASGTSPDEEVLRSAPDGEPLGRRLH